MPGEGISASAVGRKDAQGRALGGWAGGSLTKGTHGPRRYLGFSHCLKVLLVSLTHVNLALPHFLSYSKVYEESG